MKVELEMYQALILLITITGAFWGMAKMLLSQSKDHIDEQFKVIALTLKGQTDDSRRLERELLELKAELPRDYVRRTDHDRVIASLQVSLDNLRLTIERVMAGARKTP